MKIEAMSIVKNDTANQQPEGRSPKFVSGDIFVTEVVDKSGNSLTLKQANGMLFTAKLLSDIGILLGDRVEVIVQDTQDGKQLLQMLDIERPTEPQNSDSHAKAEPQIQKTGLTFSQNQGVQSQMLSNAMTMIKQNPAISPKVAMFIAANNLAPTNETVEVVTRMANEGSVVKTLLSDALSMTETQVPEPNININDETIIVPKESGHIINTEEHVPKQSGEKTDASGKTNIQEHQQDVQTKQESSTKQVSPRQEHVKPTATTEQPELIQKSTTVKTEQQAVSPKQQEQQIKNLDVEMLQANEKIEVLDTQMTDRIRSVFLKLGEGQKTAEEIKQEADKLPSKLKTLISILAGAADEDTEALSSRAVQAQRQMSLLSDTKHFTCFHWPFVLQDERANTAELFVYKHKRYKKQMDPENIVILLGLDTENIGRVETMIKASGKNISLQFHVSKTDAFAEAKKLEKQLRQMMRAEGYHLQEMDVAVLAQRTTVLNAESVLAEEAEIKQGEVDIRV